ncbi:MAG: DUF4259 domain-containing protein [Bradyrhizobiaceae bacterium]|nr:DUF4259 domain-containing protein [Bradyrhizobiaceae bacterium]
MGAWGADSYDNDTANDWAYRLEDVADLSVVRRAIGTVVAKGEDYLGSDEACEAIAACEVIARLKEIGANGTPTPRRLTIGCKRTRLCHPTISCNKPFKRSIEFWRHDRS